ncbi:MAG: LPS assembly protein LptD [Proteobacteria bacterium]|uniref:LPS-assembly protein LptD n=1 Tax=Rudaea sp. TaxID=2136325 RepID=UPI0032200409|nr:LPS assembly protein LptD [Pseudomonadota bacterium]
MLPSLLNDRRLRHLPLRPLPLLLLVALAEPVSAQTAVIAPSTTQTTCPAGVMRCVAPKNDYGKCKRNDLLDFFVPGLPPAGDRSKAQTQADANKVTWLDKNHAQLEDDVRMQKLDALLRTDFLTYNSETTDYVANGRVRYQDAGMLMSADKARGTTTPSVTYLDNVRYQMLDQRGNGVAKTVNQTDPDHSKMSYGTFSTCDPSERQWEMRANDLEIDKVRNEGYGHGVTLAYQGVPFLWLPYMSFPIDEGRHSGFLMPVIGYSNRRGFKLGIPYYLDLAPNYDLTLKPIEYTKRGPFLDTEFRYLSEWDRLMLDVGYMPKDDVTDETSRGYLRLQNWATFNANWGATVDVHRVSDDRYLRDFGDSFQSTAISLLPSSAYVNGNGGWWNIAIGGDTWQVSDPSIESFCPGGGSLQGCANPVVYKPYTRLPRVAFNIAPQRYGGFEAGMESEYINFQRGYSLTGRRLDLYPHLSYPIESLAWFVRPTVGYRITQYDLSDMRFNTNPLITSTSPSRHLPIASVDSGLFFERDAKLFDKSYIQTLEPRLFYLWAPYRNQDKLPNFDTSLPSLDFPSLFRTNAYTGGDRQADANQATIALTSRLIDAESGDQLLSGSIGQIRYFKTPRVSLPYFGNALNGAGKDLFTELQLNIGKRWSVKWDAQWNTNAPNATDPGNSDWFGSFGRRTDLNSFSLQRRFGTDGVVNLSYRYRRGFLEQYDATALVPLNLRWSIVGRYYYSIKDKRLLESFAGVQYDSCCVAARLVARRWLNNASNPFNDAIYIPNNVKAENTVFFEVEFKGMGASGQRTQNFLRHAILGYQ